MDTTSTETPGMPASSTRRRVILPAAIILVYSIVVSRLPLLNYLGYEYSAAVALIFPLVPGLFFLRSFGRKTEGGRIVLVQSLACLVLPLAVGYLNALFVKNCSPGEGLAWYVLIPCAGMVWVAALAYFCATVFRRRVLWYILILAGVMIHPLLLGYFTPRVDSYNFMYGYFPGFTYDEDLRIDSVLILWRGVTIVYAAGLFLAGGILLGRRRQREMAAGSDEGGSDEIPRPVDTSWSRPTIKSGLWMSLRIAFLLIIIVSLSAAWLYRTDLGFETTAGSLRKTLGSLAETRHFRIYYDSTSISADEIKWVAAEHEFRYYQLSRFLGTDTTRVIESYIYPDTDTKRRLIGAGNTDIAKPWRGEIHLDGESWRVTLKHELAHALAAEFGMTVIRANINIGLVEGLAMAASPSFGNRTLQEYAASMIHFGIVDDPAALIRPAGFAFQSSTVSYVLMGAFCDYLIGRHGMPAFKTWYGGGSPEDAYGVDADSLIAEWRGSLETIRVPESWRAHTDYYFRRGSIFGRECARAVANLNADGGRSLERKDYAAAKNSFMEGLEKSWNASSFVGLTRALLGIGDFDGVIRMFEAERDDTLKRGSFAGVKLLYGDALMMKNDYAGARRVYEEIRALDLSPGMNEAVVLRIVIAGTADLREYLAPVLAGTMVDSVSLEWLSGITSADNPAVLSYLRGKMMVAKGDYGSVVRETAEYLAPFPYSDLNGGLNDVAAGAFFRLGDFLSARAFYERTLDYSPGPVLIRRVRDRQERCDWFGREWAGLNLKLSPVVDAALR